MKKKLNLKAKRECPVIAVTACTDQSTHSLAFRAGIKELVNKPVSSNALRSIL